VAAVVVEEGLSGDDRGRPGLPELEETFAAHHAAGCPAVRLLVAHTDRLSRSDALDAFALLARLRDLGLRHVVTPQRPIDLRNRLDRTLYALEQDHANNPFLATMAERALNGMAEVARDGFWVGRTPLGYKLERRPGEHGAGKRRRSGRLVIDEERAPTVLELFERYAGGESATDLAAWLTALVKPPRATAWSANTVRQLLQSEVYVGTRVFGRRARGKHVRLGANGRPTPKEDGRSEDNFEASLVIRHAVPAIVGEELFARVRARLAGGRRRGYHKAARPLPLSGLGKCGSCGGALHAVYAWAKGRRRRLAQLLCASRHRYGAAACPDGSTGSSHDGVLGVVFSLLADTLLSDGAPKRLTALAEERAGEAGRRLEASKAALLRRLTDLDATLARSQVRLLDIAEDLREDFEAGLRRVKQQKADALAELELRGRNVSNLYPWASTGAPIVACEPSCVLPPEDDYPALLRGELRRQAELVAGACLTLGRGVEDSARAILRGSALPQKRRQPVRIVRGEAIDPPVEQAPPVAGVVDRPGHDPRPTLLCLAHQGLVEEVVRGAVEAGARAAHHLRRVGRRRPGDQHGAGQAGVDPPQQGHAAVVEAAHHGPLDDPGRTHLLEQALLQQPGGAAVVAVADRLGVERDALQLQVEADAGHAGALLVGLPGPPAEVAGVGGGEGEQVGEGGDGVRVQAVLPGVEEGRRRRRRILVGEAARVRVAGGAVAAQLAQRQSPDRRALGGGRGAGAQQGAGRVGQARVVAEHRHPVEAEVEVGLDRGGAGVEGHLERGQGVFRAHAAGAAVALQVEGRRRLHRSPFLV
jgi:DNA invertase Pin-like site-specific DNA recombinase